MISKAQKDKIIVTAALPYANGSIHIGHLLEYIQADIYARFLKLIGQDALYICASDMHGTPIEINAKKAGIKPEKFVEKFWKEHQEDFASFLIKFDNFHKTHSPENQELVEYFYQELKKKKLIYRKKIKVIYCETCKRSLPDRYVKGKCPHCQAEDQYGDICEKCSTVLKGADLIDPYCAICNNKPVQKDSEHYFFKLSKFKGELKKWINSSGANVQGEIKNWLEGWLKNLKDWCVSRDAPYFGFEIPDAKKETGEVKYFYVWLDAPIGYISSTKNYCSKKKCDWEDYWKKGQVYHFIGKDIAYFHYLFWPAMLTGVGIPLPELTTHGWVTVNGQKMSKSRGTFFTAKDFLKLFPPEALRFYYASHLDRRVVDTDLNFDEFKAVNNNVLMGNLGNFCYRVLTFAQKNYDSVNGVANDKDGKLLSKGVSLLSEKIKKDYSSLDFKSAVKHILLISDLGNAYFQKNEPWKNKEGKKEVVGLCVNLARNLAILVQPILPEFTKKIEKALGEKELKWNDLGFNWKGKLKEVELLVEKIEKVPTSQETFPLQLKIGQIKEVKILTVTPEAKKLGIKAVMARIKDAKVSNKSEKLKKLKKGSKQPNINTVVDSYNLIATKTGVSMGCHDEEKIKGNLKIKITEGNEKYIPLGKKELVKVKKGEYACVDDEKILCWKDEKQCDQTKVTKQTKKFIIYAQGNKDQELSYVKDSLKKACELITEICGGEYNITNSENNENIFSLQLKIGQIKQVKDHPNADSLYLFKVDFGKEKRQVVAGLKKEFKPAELKGEKVVFCTNLKPAKLRGEMSEAMILVADDGKSLSLLRLEGAKAGEEVQFEGLSSSTKEVTFEEFKKLKMTVKDGKVVYEGKKLVGKRGQVIVEDVKEGARIE